MSEEQNILRFNTKIDQMLGLDQSSRVPDSEFSEDSIAAFQLASQLINVDLQTEIRPNPALRTRWTAQNRLSDDHSSHQRIKPFRLGWIWAAVIGLVLISTLLIYRQPVLAAVGRLLGYGYFPQSGFVMLDTALVLHDPVKQEHAGQSLTVLTGLATPKETTLWLKFSTDPTPPDGAWLETPTGEKLMLKTWEWDQSQSGSLELRLVFLPLSENSAQMTLALPEGWRIPIQWIPAAQAYSLPFDAVNSPSPTVRAGTPVPTLQITTPCIQTHDLQVCLKAAASDPQGTHLLLEAVSQDKQLTPGGIHGLIASNPLSGDFPLTLTDQIGNVVPFPRQSLEPIQENNGVWLQSLSFPSVSPQAQTLTLRVPAFQAQQMLPTPVQLQVDLGSDPRPGQNLKLDQELKIAGLSIQFRQAILEGDGVTSLRLILTSDPIQPQNGQLISDLILGKPEGIDDRYGSGSLVQNRLRVFTELIGVVSGKKTGVLNFPIIGVQITLSGPFEYSFPAPASPWIKGTPTPAIIPGERFTPHPSPTTMALDSYRHFNQPIEPGDVLFTVVGDTTTNLYKTHSGNGFILDLVAVLPGQVYQVYLHPDRQGIDYLAGIRTTFIKRIFYRDAQVYTLNFNSGAPTLLAAFPGQSDPMVGNEVNATWSADGRLMILQQTINQPQPGEPNRKFYWIDLDCRVSGNCKIQYLQLPAGISLWQPRFSPQGNQVLFSGLNTNERQPAGVYWLDFGTSRQPGLLSTFTHTAQTDEQSPQWLPDGKSYVSACAGDSLPMNEYDLCRRDLVGGVNQAPFRLPFSMHQFDLSPNGKFMVDTTFVPEPNQDQLRLFNLDTRQTSILKQSENMNWDFRTFSPDSLYLSLAYEQGTSVFLFEIESGKEVILLDTKKPGSISWIVWAK